MVWYEIHYCKWMGKPALYTGKKGVSGYRIKKLYESYWMAKLDAKLHGYKYCVKPVR